MLSPLDEVEVFQLRSKDDEVESRLGLQLPGVRVDRVEELERVGGAGDVAQLPVHLVMMVMMMMVVMMVVVMMVVVMMVVIVLAALIVMVVMMFCLLYVQPDYIFPIIGKISKTAFPIER